MTSRRLPLLLIAVLTLTSVLALAACSDDPGPTPTVSPSPISEPTVSTAPASTPTPVPTLTPEPTPVVLGDCRDGMRLQPGEGCRYTGGGSPQANVVLSVQHDGTICREGGPAKQESGGITINMDSLRLCVSGGFERDDAFQSEIVSSVNADGSWTFYESSLSASDATAPTVTLPDPTKEPIIFSELLWESAQLQNRIAQYIIEYGYGHPTGIVSGSIPFLFEGLQRGDIDVTMEVWLPGQKLEWDKARSEGQVLDVGQSLGFVWQSAFVIPAYLQEQYPNLDSVEDLKDPQFRRLFQTAESGDKARLVSCVIGWDCERTNTAQIAGYGLEDHVDVVNPTSEGVLDADLYATYERGEPWLGYQWSTNDPVLKLELVRLEEPAYSEECWSTTRACAYEDATILIAVNADLPLEAPDVVATLGKWDFDIDAYEAVVKWQGASGVTDPTAAATWWLESNLEIWSEWVTDDATANVQAALDRGEKAAGWSRVITMPRPEPTPPATATSTPVSTPTTDPRPADGICRVGLIVGPGESCTYPGTSLEFSVDSSGRGQFLFFTAGTGIDARNTTINGVTYNFKASKQDDGSWIIEAAGDL